MNWREHLHECNGCEVCGPRRCQHSSPGGWRCTALITPHCSQHAHVYADNWWGCLHPRQQRWWQLQALGVIAVGVAASQK